jgi:hypothetical protein
VVLAWRRNSPNVETFGVIAECLRRARADLARDAAPR